MQIFSHTLGLARTNVYIVADMESGDAVVIDPVDDAPLIYKTAQDNKLTIKLILATHGHFDHVLASAPLKEMTDAPFYIHEEAQPFLDHLPQTGVRFTGNSFPKAAIPDRYLTTEPETIEVGNLRFETLYTPGHAPGHISFFMPGENILFSGDSLFASSVGRTDLPGGDHDLLMRSIVDKLLPLGDDVRVLPGHMQATTIGQEKHTNPFILGYRT